MTMRRARVRRATMAVTGVALATSLGLAGAGVATAAKTTLHVKNGSKWNVQILGSGCDIATFKSSGTFTTNPSTGTGTWSGGSASLIMKWTAGNDSGLKFKGTYVSSSKEYSGTISGSGGSLAATVVKGSSCLG